jgi:hypothetical protein
VEPDRDSDLCNWIDWIDIGHAARNRVRDLGSGVFVAWRCRLAHRRLALFRRLDGHAGCIRANAATTLAADGGLEAVNGMILFGVSTAYVFAVMQLYWSMLAK